MIRITSTLFFALTFCLALPLSAQFTFQAGCDLNSPANAGNSNPTFAADIETSGGVQLVAGDQVGIFNAAGDLLGTGAVEFDMGIAFTSFSVSFINNRVGGCPAFSNGETITVNVFDASTGETIPATNGSFAAQEISGTVEGFDFNTAFSFDLSLPIELSTFTATPSAKQSVRLVWTASLEEDASHYEVEHSKDGSAWSMIDRLDAANRGDASVSYELIDRAAVTGQNYYRLRMVDLDGSFSYSEVAAVNLASSANLSSIAPNPVALHGKVNVRLNDTWNLDATRASLHSMTGRQFADWTIARSADRVELPDGLPAGLYLFRVNDGAQEQTHRLVVR